MTCALARAESGVTNTVSGVATNYPGGYSVGTNGAFNALIITNAGVVTVSGNGTIGNSAISSSNFVWVTGVGSLWSNSGFLYVGATGAFNQLTIANGGRLLNGNGYIGNNVSASNNSVWVSGAGSVWSNRLNLFVGNNGPGGRLTIGVGGTAIASNVTVGVGSTSTGNVLTLSGGSLRATNALRTGTLDVRRGALVLDQGTGTVNRLFVTNGASSAVTFNGGTLSSGSSLVNNGAQFRVGNGVNAAQLNLNGGAHWFANGLSISANATLSGTGTIGKPIIGNVSDAGVIAPGNSAGSLTFDCDLTLLSTALLSIELGGTNDWLYDQINVEETLNFQGSLSVSLLGGFTPQFGDWFDLFDFGDANGRFNRINLPALGPALYWNTDYLYTTGRLLVGDQQAAWMVSPTGGSTFASSQVTFVWDRGTPASRYALWVGSTPGSYDLYAGVETGRSRTLTLPTDGRLIYVRLWSWVNGAWQQGRSYTYTAATAGTARMLGPTDGATLAGASTTFIWDAGVGATQYRLWVGSSSNGSDLYDGIERSLSRQLTLPLDGRTLYVTLHSWINGAWQSNAYTYVAATAAKAQMLSPTDGATLSAASATFSWDAGVGATQYALWVGSSSNSYDLYAGFERGQSRAVALPADGRALYVTLWSLINGVWQSNAYTYTAYTAPPAATAQMLSPADGSTITGNWATFIWDKGNGVSLYALWVGSSWLRHDMYAGVENGLSRRVSVPTDGRMIFVTLFSLINGAWQAREYSYVCGGGSPAPRRAQMLRPVNGSTLTGTSTTFIWDPGVSVTQYALWVGNAPQTWDIYAGSEYAGSESKLWRTLTLPANGQTLYVTLWSSINGVWQSNAYTYTASTSVPAPSEAQMLSPANGSTINGGAATFIWDKPAGVTQYRLWIGSSPLGYDYYQSTETGQSRWLSLPTDGRRIYVTLWSWSNGSWQSNAYGYICGSGAAPTRTAARMLRPVNGTTLTEAATTFIWDDRNGVTSYALWVGSSPLDYDLYEGTENSQSRTVTLPADGRTLYVTLWSLVNDTWQSNAYTYTAYNAGASPKAQMLSPVNGSTLSAATATFIWDTGVGVTQYALWVGSHPNSYDLYAGWESGLSRTLVLPTDGRTLYVRLWSWINGAWQWNDYQYTASGL